MLRIPLLLAALLASVRSAASAEDGYELWLRYRLVTSASLLAEYRGSITHLIVADNSATLRAARHELATGLRGLLGINVPFQQQVQRAGALIAGTPGNSSIIAGLNLSADLQRVGEQGFLLRSTT